MRQVRIPPAALAAAAEPSPDALAMLLLSYPRAHLEALTDALVAALDARDGNPDHEEDDWPGDMLDLGELDDSRLLNPPIYGVDQSKGPLNEIAAHRAYEKRQRTATGRTVL